MTDRTTKLLLAAIAFGLWMNVAGDWLRPVAVQAQNDRYLRNIRDSVRDIENAVGRISRGTCINSEIC